MVLLLLIILLLLLFGGLPRWGYHSYGYGPSGIVGAILIVVAYLVLDGPNLRVLSVYDSRRGVE